MGRKAYNAIGVLASGPYSHAVDAGELVFLSGQTSMNAEPAKILKGDISAQN